MLSNLRERIDNKDKSMTDLNYCIKMIASNQLYEASFIDDEEESSAKEGDVDEEKRLSEKKKNTQDVRAWHRQFQTGKAQQAPKRLTVKSNSLTEKRRTSLMVPNLKGLQSLG